ncbi:MAG: response regulator [Deltaproteobacteria bacterium]|nr:response regulator [Deltaproteobacteria bacterium]
MTTNHLQGKILPAFVRSLSLVLILLLLGLPAVSFADTSAGPMKFEYVFDIGGEPGFAIIQDRDGFLWFSSFYNGMLRFDGSSKWMIREGPAGISNDFVTQLFEDRDGHIWAGTNHGLNRYDKRTNTITRFFKDPARPESSLAGNVFNLSSRTIIQDRQGYLWFGTQSGLSRYDPKTARFNNHQHDPGDPHSLSDNDIFGLFEDGDGFIWVATKNQGVNRFDLKTGQFTRFTHDPNDPDSLPDNAIQSIVQDRDGHLWFATREDGLIRRDRASGRFSHFKHDPDDSDSLPRMSIWNLVLMNSGEIALISDSSAVGLVLFDPRTGKHRQHRKKPGDPFSLSTDTVHGVFEDRDGTLWIMHNNGKVDKSDPRAQQFTLYRHNPLDNRSLASDAAVPVFENRHGHIWVGHFGSGLDRYNPDTDDFTHHRPDSKDPTSLPHGYPAGFFETHRGKFIVSTAAGMVYFDPFKGEVTEKITDDTWFYTMLQDDEDPNVIWAVGWEQSLNRFNLNTRERKVYRHDPQDPNSFAAVTAVRFIYDRYEPDTFWIATWGGGLEKFNSRRETFTHHQHDPEDPHSISSNTVYDVMQDFRGTVWASTDRGLNKFDAKTGKFKRFDKSTGFDAKIVHNMLEDRSGRLWMGTNIGLVVFDIIHEQVVKVYTTEDGLHSHDFFPTARGKTSDGQLWFGGFNGLNRFDPDNLKENKNPPQIFLTAIKQSGKAIESPVAFEHLREINLGWRENFFEFGYVALNYTIAGKNRYRYMLEGLDRDWVPAGKQRTGRYSGLQGGTYTLRINGTNNDGIWNTSEQEVRLTVNVQPPPWVRWWAWMLYAVGGGLFFYAVVRWRLRASERQRVLLQEEVDARTVELRKLSQATENSPASVVVTDKNGTIEYVNQTFSEITGYSAEKAIGKNPRLLKSGIHPNSFYKNLWDTILSGKTWQGEFRNQKKTGEKFWESASISAINNEDGDITHFVAVKQDITERKRMEQDILSAKEKAEEATRAKSDFLANMSHEIRTPMNAVIGMSYLALQTDLNAKQQDYLSKIQSSANSLLGIINDILDFSKIEAGKLDMESVEFNLDDVLDNLANLVTVKAQEKENLEVLFATDQEVPRFLVGDPLRLGQVLINLANNAVKFTESGEIVVSTELSMDAETDLKIKFSVKDTGIGLSEDQIGKLFQSFSQADTSTTRKFGGTGLGLTISKRLVTMMGGEIWVDSEPGQGTTFSFTAKFGYGKGTVKKHLVPSSDLNGMNVLVVDDSAASRDILQDMLESFSFKVTLAASAEEGLEEIFRADSDQPYELVIMDWKMPGMDGLEASGQIKNHQTLSRIPAIILVTAYGREQLMRQAGQIGLDGFLIKPVGPSVLFDTIMDVFGEEISPADRISEKKIQSEDLTNIKGAQILLVEDNEINQQVAREILAGGGLKVTVANDGQEAVNAVQNGDYDVILMDIQMPVMDGYTATRQIRKWESGMPNEGKDPIPIIAMTAHAMAGDEQKSLKAGMNDHVTKPIDPEQLFASLVKWIKPAAAAKGLPAPEGPAAAAPSEHDPAVPDENDLPDSLPGFDLTAGLARIMGNKRLYRKLLLDFGANYGGAANEIRQALEAGDFEQAHSLVHNIKGLAGNLEALDLKTAAVNIEILVKGQSEETVDEKQLQDKIAALEYALAQALDAVQTLGPAAEKPTLDGNEPPWVSVPPELIKRAGDDIIAAAEMGDVTQIKAMAEELKSESDAMAPFSDELIRLVDDFDFDGILKMVRALDS